MVAVAMVAVVYRDVELKRAVGRCLVVVAVAWLLWYGLGKVVEVDVETRDQSSRRRGSHCLGVSGALGVRRRPRYMRARQSLLRGDAFAGLATYLLAHMLVVPSICPRRPCGPAAVGRARAAGLALRPPVIVASVRRRRAVRRVLSVLSIRRQAVVVCREAGNLRSEAGNVHLQVEFNRPTAALRPCGGGAGPVLQDSPYGQRPTPAGRKASIVRVEHTAAGGSCLPRGGQSPLGGGQCPPAG
ncbi:hypothetical protein B0T24DRAFT_123865 [Lasiosphaeria ovina]|uniref:Uncharacterized protein n=1 Tax=Lasiosphaeria ovina TaxID=92902 RepID=A0AAE0JS79_9PEZI|nr:hypothetical protein B0T24DRAFT_123865 [Lasiosphaeria ovina]